MIALPTEAEPVTVVCGDAADVLPSLPVASFDSIVTDPPYGLVEPRSNSNIAGAFAPARKR